MYFPYSGLLSLAACCGVLNAAAIAERGSCNSDNCLRGLNGYSIAAAFCASYTTATSTATTGLPTFATQCTGSMASRISSACSCYAATATTSSLTTTSSITCTAVTPTATATLTQTASTVTATQPATTITLPVNLPASTVTLPITLPASTNTVTLPANTVTLPAVTVTVAAAAPAPTGYSLGFGFDPIINYVSDNLVSFAAVQDPTNAYGGQSYLLAQFDPSINSGDVTPQITVSVLPNTNYVADGYFKKGLASGTCTVAVAVLNGAGIAYVNVGNGGTYHIHALTTAYTYDSTAFNSGANTQLSVRYISSCYNANGDSIYYDNLTLHAV
ncbi:hypothetical protein MMC17_006404 [Xylographa soralifera]|nr:hypothetical protein [Xylographa soralifera]